MSFAIWLATPTNTLGSKTQPHIPQQAIKTRPPKTVKMIHRTVSELLEFLAMIDLHRAPMGILLGRLAQDKGRREKIPLANFQVIGYNNTQLLCTIDAFLSPEYLFGAGGHQVCGVGRSRLCSHAR